MQQSRRIISVVSVPQQLAAAQGKCLDLDPTTAATYFAPNEGTLDPLYVRALVLDDGVRRMAILKIDAVGFSRALRDEILPLAASLGIAPELLVGAATHTHSGPGAISKTLIWELVATDCFNQPAYDTLLATFKRALLAAVADLRPARLGIGRTVERAANENRRGRPGISDPELAIIKVLDEASGAPLAAVINYAIHGTVCGADNLKFSRDVLGFTEREIERKLGAGVALFLNAAEGDVAPAQGMHSGDLLSDAFVAAWPGVATSPHTELKGAFEEAARSPRNRFRRGSAGKVATLIPEVGALGGVDRCEQRTGLERPTAEQHAGVVGRGDGCEQADQGQHERELDQRESPRTAPPAHVHA